MFCALGCMSCLTHINKLHHIPSQALNFCVSTWSSFGLQLDVDVVDKAKDFIKEAWLVRQTGIIMHFLATESDLVALKTSLDGACKVLQKNGSDKEALPINLKKAVIDGIKMRSTK
jgi:hypothetical protein